MQNDDSDASLAADEKDTLAYLAERLKMSVEETITFCKKLGYVQPNARTRIPSGAQENAIQFITRLRERKQGWSAK